MAPVIAMCAERLDSFGTPAVVLARSIRVAPRGIPGVIGAIDGSRHHAGGEWTGVLARLRIDLTYLWEPTNSHYLFRAFEQTRKSTNVLFMIWGFVNQKGGVGKSTLSQNVADCLSRLGQKVLLIDADKQGTSSDWASLRSENRFAIVSMARENMAQDAMRIAADYDFTIIDGPPHADAISRSCIVASDLVIVPIEPGGASRWSSDLTVRQLKEAQQFKPTLKCGFVVARKITGTVLGRDARAMASDAGIPIFKTEIEQRVAYAEALTMGKTIFEWGSNAAAVREIRALTHELLDTYKSDEQVVLSGTKATAAFG